MPNVGVTFVTAMFQGLGWAISFALVYLFVTRVL